MAKNAGQNTIIFFVFYFEIHQILSKTDFELHSAVCDVTKSHCVQDKASKEKLIARMT